MSADLTENLPEQSAALVFNIDGTLEIATPREGTFSDENRMPESVLACTELLLRFSEGDLSVNDLAAAFIKRSQAAS